MSHVSNSLSHSNGPRRRTVCGDPGLAPLLEDNVENTLQGHTLFGQSGMRVALPSRLRTTSADTLFLMTWSLAEALPPYPINLFASWPLLWELRCELIRFLHVPDRALQPLEVRPLWARQLVGELLHHQVVVPAVCLMLARNPTHLLNFVVSSALVVVDSSHSLGSLVDVIGVVCPLCRSCGASSCWTLDLLHAILDSPARPTHRPGRRSSRRGPGSSSLLSA